MPLQNNEPIREYLIENKKPPLSLHFLYSSCFSIQRYSIVPPKVWIFLRSYFFKNERSVENFLTISFIKIRFSWNQNIGETLFYIDVLITKESNFDERNGQDIFN